MRLATVLSVAAAMVALTLEALGDVSTAPLVGAVALVGFCISWVQTGRITRSVEARFGASGPRNHTRQPVA
jgi:hypothetical protein